MNERPWRFYLLITFYRKNTRKEVRQREKSKKDNLEPIWWGGVNASAWERGRKNRKKQKKDRKKECVFVCDLVKRIQYSILGREREIKRQREREGKTDREYVCVWKREREKAWKKEQKKQFNNCSEKFCVEQSNFES